MRRVASRIATVRFFASELAISVAFDAANQWASVV
jgi:hypothetical protein